MIAPDSPILPAEASALGYQVHFPSFLEPAPPNSRLFIIDAFRDTTHRVKASSVHVSFGQGFAHVTLRICFR
jgi:hypothetical protein